MPVFRMSADVLCARNEEKVEFLCGSFRDLVSSLCRFFRRLKGDLKNRTGTKMEKRNLGGINNKTPIYNASQHDDCQCRTRKRINHFVTFPFHLCITHDFNPFSPAPFLIVAK